MALIHIAGNTYELIFENRNGWNVEAFRNRYSEVLERYDYIVGDWGYNQLRLKGFFRDGHQKATKDSTYSYMTDYINEYCNFGCAYFILEKKQDNVEAGDAEVIFIDEVEYTRPVPVPKEPKEKSASISAVEEGASPQREQRGKQRPQRDKQGQSSDSENGSDKPRPRHQRQGGQKQHNQQQDKQDKEAGQDIKQEPKKEGKPKRKEHFYRKGRSGDRKGKGNKQQQAERVSTSSES